MLGQKRQKTAIVMDVMFFPRATQDAGRGPQIGGVSGQQLPVDASIRSFVIVVGTGHAAHSGCGIDPCGQQFGNSSGL